MTIIVLGTPPRYYTVSVKPSTNTYDIVGYCRKVDDNGTPINDSLGNPLYRAKIGGSVKYVTDVDGVLTDDSGNAVSFGTNDVFYVWSDYFHVNVTEDGVTSQRYRVNYNDKVLEAAAQLNIPGFDIYRRSGRNRYNIWTLCPSDGTHPTSVAGRNSEADYYAKALMSI